MSGESTWESTRASSQHCTGFPCFQTAPGTCNCRFFDRSRPNIPEDNYLSHCSVGEEMCLPGCCFGHESFRTILKRILTISLGRKLLFEIMALALWWHFWPHLASRTVHLHLRKNAKRHDFTRLGRVGQCFLAAICITVLDFG